MEFDINRFDETPRFLQLVRIISANIDNEVWGQYEAIPTERALCEEYNLSRTTVRKAIEKLVDMFYLFRVHGKGTFVCPRQLREFRKISGMGFREHALNRGQVPSQDILSLEIVPVTDVLRDQLNLDKEVTEVQKLVRLFYLDGNIDSINTSYLALPDGKTITIEELEKVGSLYTLLNRKFNYTPFITCQESIPMKATEEVARLLNQEVGNPVAYITGVVWTLDYNVMEYAEIYRTDKTIPHQSMNVGGFL